MGAACSLWGLVHMTNNELAIRQRQELPPSRMPMVLAVTAAVGALILITVVI
jgi:uncharacterized membrane protein YidH (DUF202 family)